jgi:hypothetical protein
MAVKRHVAPVMVQLEAVQFGSSTTCMLIASIRLDHAFFTLSQLSKINLSSAQMSLMPSVKPHPLSKVFIFFFYILPDKAFQAWWVSKGRDPIPDNHVIPVQAAMQGHPEAGRLWEKHIDKILHRDLHLMPTIQPCLYSGQMDGHRVLFKRQVDDFATAVSHEDIATKIFDALDSKLRMPMR